MKNKYSIYIVILILLVGSLFKYNDILIDKGDSMFLQSDFQKAESYYDKVFINYLYSTDSLLNKANTKFELEKLTEGMDSLTKAEKKVIEEEDTEKLESIYYNKAYCYYKLPNYNSSIDYFNKYIKLDTEDNFSYPIALKYLADSYFYEENYDDSISILNKGIEISLKNDNKVVLLSLYDRLIDCYISKNEYDKALIVNEKLLESNPNEPYNYLTQFYLYRHSEGVEYSNKYLLQLKEKFPDNEKIDSFINNLIKTDEQ